MIILAWTCCLHIHSKDLYASVVVHEEAGMFFDIVFIHVENCLNIKNPYPDLNRLDNIATLMITVLH